MSAREATAWGLVAVVAAALLGIALLSFTGGGTFVVAGLPVSVTSWKVLRALVPIAAVAFWLLPRESEWLHCIAARLRRSAPMLLGGLLSLAGAWLVSFKILQHLSFGTGAYDLTMFHHAVHNTLEGRFLFAFGIERNFLSEHASPILLLLVPLYALAPSPLTLLTAQAAAMALACIPLYKLARHRGLPVALSCAVPAIFLFNEFTWRAFAFDFHVELFAPLFVFWAALLHAQQRWALFYIALALLFSVKEDMALVGLALAVWIAVHNRRAWRHAVVTAALSVLWAVIAWKLIIPLSYPEGPRESHFIERYAHLGCSYGAIALGLLTQPGFVIDRIFSPAMGRLLMSLGGLPLLHPVSVVLAVPTVLLHLVSDYEPQARLGSYYGLNALMLMMLGLPAALERLRSWTRTSVAVFWAIAVLALGAWAPFARIPDAADAHGRLITASLPVEEGVSAQHKVVPHLFPSPKTRLFPATDGAAWVALDLEGDTWPLAKEAYHAQVAALLADPGWGVEQIAHQRFIVVRRSAPRDRNEEALRALHTRFRP